MRSLLALALLLGSWPPAAAQTVGALGAARVEGVEEENARDAQPFFADPASIDDADYNLLVSNGYRFDPSRMLYAPGSSQPVTKGDYPFVLEEIKSQKRLRALVAVNTILARNGFSKKLPKDDLEAVRAAARENWALLSKKTRGELMPYFRSEEIERMTGERPKRLTASPMLTSLPMPPTEETYSRTEGEQPRAEPPALRDVPRAQMTPVAGVALSMPRSARSRYAPARADAGNYDAAAAAVVALRAAAEAGQAALAALDAARGASPRDSLVMPLPAPWPKETLSPKATPKPRASPALPEVKAMPAPWPKDLPKAVPAPSPAVSQTMAAEAAAAVAEAGAAAPALLPAEAVAAALRAGMAPPEPAIPAANPTALPVPAAAEPPLPAVSTPSIPEAAAEKPAEAPVQAAPVAIRPQRPEIVYPPFDAAAFATFLSGSPYSRDVKDLLALLAKHAREPERHIALGVVQAHLPHILIDSQKTGNRARAAIYRLPAEAGVPARYLIALNDGPVAAEHKRLVGADGTYLLPDAPDFYRERGLPIPALKAFARESAAEREQEGAFGKMRVFSDGSKKLHYSPEQVAGSLLKQLMNLDAAMRGWDSDLLHVELRSWASQFRFYRSLGIDLGKEPALDAELGARFREWLERPEDHLDFIVQTLSAPREAAWMSALSGEAQARYDAQRRWELETLQASGVFASGEVGRLIERLPAPATLEPPPNDPSLASGDADAEASWLLQEHDARAKP